MHDVVTAPTATTCVAGVTAATSCHITKVVDCAVGARYNRARTVVWNNVPSRYVLRVRGAWLDDRWSRIIPPCTRVTRLALAFFTKVFGYRRERSADLAVFDAELVRARRLTR